MTNGRGRSTWRWLALVAFAQLAAPFAQAAPAVQTGGEITAVYRAGNVESLDPPSASAGTDWRMAGLILYNTLYRYDVNGKLVPDLAAGMPRISPNGKVYTIQILRGVRFHN
ncbi:MAG TPA: hypothetical protein VGK88_12765, partial [bacterium]